LKVEKNEVCERLREMKADAKQKIPLHGRNPKNARRDTRKTCRNRAGDDHGL